MNKDYEREKTFNEVLKIEQAEKQKAAQSVHPQRNMLAGTMLGGDACEQRQNSATIIQKRAEGLRRESELYAWLQQCINVLPPNGSVESELYNLLTAGYRPRAY